MNETVNIIAVAIVVWLPAIIATAYYIGRIRERTEWNKLIAKGILPKPPQR